MRDPTFPGTYVTCIHCGKTTKWDESHDCQ